MGDKQAGILMKYFVLKPGGSGEYAKASRHAMIEYARIIEKTNKDLADDLKAWADKELFLAMEKASKGELQDRPER